MTGLLAFPSRPTMSPSGRIVVVALGVNLLACTAAREPERAGEAAAPRASALGAPAPTVGPEIPVDMPVRVQWDGPGIGIAAGASSHLFVWRSDTNLYAARVGFDGAIIDQLPFRLTATLGMQLAARVVSNGTDWLVAYPDDRGGGLRVTVARVAADGTVRDPDGRTVSDGTGDHLLQGIASDGSDFLVTWDASGLRAAIVTGTGVVQAPFMVGGAISSGPGRLSAAGFNGSEYLVAYYNGSNLRARRVSRAGAPVGSTIELGTDPAVSLVDVASDGTSWLVSYVSDALRWQVVAAGGALGGSGSVAGPFGGSTTDPVSRLSATGNGAGYTLCTVLGAELFVARLGADGSLLASTTPPVQGDVFEAAVVRGGSSDFVAYVAAVPGIFSAPAYGSRLDSSLRLDASPRVLSFRANSQISPRAAFNGTDTLVVWEDTRGAQSAAAGGLWLESRGAVHGRRFGPGGQPLGSSAFTIAPVARPLLMPDVGSNGTDYLVVWAGGDVADGLYGRRVSAAGAVVDTNAIPIDLGPGMKRFPAVGSNGTDYYVAWTVDMKEIRGARVLANGTMPSVPTALATTASAVTDNPAIAFNGTSYLVAWGEDDDIMATRVSPASGALLDTPRIVVAGNLGAGRYRPAVASDGAEWLVVWDSNRDIRAARVAADGTVKDPNGITIDSASESQVGASVAWAGSHYWVAWSGPRNVIPAKRVTPLGAVVDATGIPITDGIYYSAAGPMIDVAAAGAGRALIVYPRFEFAQGGASRVYGKIVPSPSGAGGAGGSGGATGAGGAAGTGGVAGAGGVAGTGGVSGATGAGGTSAGGAGGGSGTGGGRGGTGGSTTGGSGGAATGGSVAGGSGGGGRGGAGGGTGGSAAGGSGGAGRGGAGGAQAGGGGSDSDDDDDGCKCGYSPAASTPGPVGIFLLGLFVAGLRRRRKRPGVGAG